MFKDKEVEKKLGSNNVRQIHGQFFSISLVVVKNAVHSFIAMHKYLVVDCSLCISISLKVFEHAWLFRAFNVTAAPRVEWRIFYGNVVRPISESEVLVNHHLVVAPSRDFPIHLSCLLSLLCIIVLLRPFRSAHPLQHVDCKDRHGQIKHVVDHDCHKEKVEIIRALKFPYKQSGLECLQIGVVHPNGYDCLL